MRRITTTQILACWLILCPIFCIAQNSTTDSLALVALYNATDGPNWTNTWNLNQPINTWYAVHLDGNSRVIELSLYDNQLTGNIPSELENLDNLKILYLHANQLSGNIPLELGNLANLEVLHLYDNQLSGDIPPELSNLSTLRHLVLGNNSLSGVIPAELGDLINLEVLKLYNNQLTDNIPTELGDLSKLYDLDLGSNQLNSNIPVELGNLSDLMYLNLHTNQLIGNIPIEFGNLNNLSFLNLRHNQLIGTVPSELGNLSNLTYLSLHNNQLDGCYDANLSNLCTQLEPIHNSNANISNGNNFDVTWEDFCNAGAGECTDSRTQDSLALVALYNSTDGPNWTNTWNLVQPMDTWYGVTLNEEGRVERLVLSDNQLNRNIPPEIGDLSNLTDLRLSNNQLTGNIPPEIENLSSLTRLFLSRNQLIGSIPTEIGNLTNLTDLHLDINKLNDTIPSEIGNLINLISLSLGSNDLSGSIPPEIGNLSDLWSLSLDNMPLTGSIPPEIGNLDNLVFLYLQNSNYSGSIPTEIGNMDNLLLLWASDNQFSDTIPDLSNLTTSHVRLYRNNFSHEDILANYAANSAISYFYYSPQYHGEVQSCIVKLDTSLTLSLSAPLPGNNNQNVSYQWKKNDTELVGSTDSVFTITNLQISDVGKYTLHMTDSTRVVDLEVISEPIYVILPGYDLYGQPVEYEQLIIEFDDIQDKENYETNHLFPNGAFAKDSCSCNRPLYLYQFPNDSIALQILLDIDTKKQTQTRGGEVDGGFNNILGIGPIPGTQGWTWTGDYPDSYPDSVSIFLLDSGADTLNWDAKPYLHNHAPIDICHDTISCAGYDYADTLTTIQGGFVDSIGHGTFGMRSIAEGSDVYMNMNIVPLKVFDKDGRGTLFNFICALYHAIDHDADIINISAGYSGQPSDILEEAVALAHSKGQFIVTATGNEGVNIDSLPQYPAYYAKPFTKTKPDGTEELIHYDNVISVATIDAMDSLWQYSNYGNEAATICAYGENMGGYSHTGDEVSYSGTSISTYYVTRQLAAEIARDKTRSLQDIWSDFEADYLRDCPTTNGLTSTGKCLDISLREVYSDLWVFLEGAFDTSGDTMRTDLNTMHHILPGQIDSTFDHETAIQPYNIVPFDYYGTESVPIAFNNYPPEVVDWILVSARTEIDASTTVNRTAAWLLKDGRVQLLKPLFNELATAPDSVYIVIEHRNHMGIMSPQKLPVKRNVVTWDFTIQDTYTTSTSVGQTMLDNLRWAMLAGDTGNDLNGYDINGADKGVWDGANGTFRIYFPADFNMDGDINGHDKIYWLNNNGQFSGVPRY